MSIRITWSEYGSNNVGSSSVYRSQVKETLYDPGNKIAEIPAGSGSYVDSPPLKDTVYYYGLITETNLGPLKSTAVAVADLVNTIGPGGLTVRIGTTAFGVLSYDSTLASGVSVGTSYIQSKVPVVSDLGFTNPTMRGTYPNTMVKFIRNGKIVIMPNAYQSFFICATPTKRAELTQILTDSFLNGPVVDFMGYSVKYDLLTKEELTDMYLGLSLSGGVLTRVSPWMVSSGAEATGGSIMFRDGNALMYATVVAGKLEITSVSSLAGQAGARNNYIGWVMRPVEG